MMEIMFREGGGIGGRENSLLPTFSAHFSLLSTFWCNFFLLPKLSPPRSKVYLVSREYAPGQEIDELYLFKKENYGILGLIS